MRPILKELEHGRWWLEMLRRARRGILLKGGILHVETE